MSISVSTPESLTVCHYSSTGYLQVSSAISLLDSNLASPVHVDCRHYTVGGGEGDQTGDVLEEREEGEELVQRIFINMKTKL